MHMSNQEIFTVEHLIRKIEDLDTAISESSRQISETDIEMLKVHIMHLYDKLIEIRSIVEEPTEDGNTTDNVEKDSVPVDSESIEKLLFLVHPKSAC